MDWMLLPIRRYADFSGRSRRKEYWMFALGLVILYTILTMILLGSLGTVSGFESGRGPSPFSSLSGLLFAVLLLATIIPSLAVQVRRFHDQDKSGWLVLLGLIPYVGALIVLVFMCLEGTTGTNSYGPDPKADWPPTV